MRYESARHDSPEQVFESLALALKHIEGSLVGSTRPWVRVALDERNETQESILTQLRGSFLIVGGHKLDARSAMPPPKLDPADQALFDAWRHIPPDISILLKEIDLCNNGYARVDCLSKGSRQCMALAVSSGFVHLSPGPFGIHVLHRPELRMGVHAVESPPSTRTVGDDSDWEGAILERQDRESMCG